MVEYGLSTPSSQLSVGGFLTAGVVGAATGLVGGAAGRVIVGAVARTVIGRAVMGVADRALGRVAGAVERSVQRLIGRGASEAEASAGSGARSLAESCAVNSFAGTTPVLMASGALKAIQDVRVGDRVRAGDAQKGETRAELVQRVIVGRGLKHLVDIAVAGEKIEATYNHPFWVVEDRKFEWADQLKAGEHLLLASGGSAPILSLARRDQVATVYNLSIQEIHTFFVGTAPVLVHNSCISVSQQDAQHVLDRHFEGGRLADPAKKSIFASGEDVNALAGEASSVPAVPQPNGRYARTVFAGRLVGFERGTGQGTMVFTTITRSDDSLVTAFPGMA
jgi:hypothetical protein